MKDYLKNHKFAYTFGCVCENKDGFCTRTSDGFYAVAYILDGKWVLRGWVENPEVSLSSTNHSLVEWETIDLEQPNSADYNELKQVTRPVAFHVLGIKNGLPCVFRFSSETERKVVGSGSLSYH